MARARVVHVVPADLSRGAQVYARALRDRLDGRPDVHRTLAIFARPDGPLAADERLQVRPGLGRRLGFDGRAAWRLRSRLRRLAPDLVVAHGGEALKYVAAAAPRSVPVVYYKIGTAVHMDSPIRRALHRHLARRATITAAVSEETAQEARTVIGVPDDRVRVVANGRDPVAYVPRPEGPTSVPARLMFVGHLTASKRPEQFVALVRTLHEDGLPVRGILVGDGPLAGTLAREAEGLPVELMGSRPDVPALLASADVLVFTSRPAGEGMPGVLIEAGLAGIPVVATEVAGARTVIDDGTSGRVVAVDDLDALVEAVRALVADPAARARMGAAARSRCLDRFTLDASASAWQTIIDELLPRR